MVLLKSEAKIHQKCHAHENIVTILSSFEDEKFNFIMLELCSQSLSDHLFKQYFIDFDDWLIFMRQILNGVNFMHQKNVIHRDLKLCNILLNQHNVVKICDFGLAIDANSPQAQLKQFCGTIPYLSPEIVNRASVVLKSDIWAVTVIGYYLFKGVRPFDRKSDHEHDEHGIERICTRIRNAEFALNDRDDPGFKEFIKVGFQIEPELRPTAGELLQLPLFGSNHNSCKRLRILHLFSNRITRTL